MQALPSAFFHQVSSAVRILVPRAWMAKSTMVVVPPMAAARVPVRKSSADWVPPKGMSRWVWASMPPGRSKRPVASMTVEAAEAGMPGRISFIVAPSIRRSARRVESALTMAPFWIRTVGLEGFYSMDGKGLWARILFAKGARRIVHTAVSLHPYGAGDSRWGVPRTASARGLVLGYFPHAPTMRLRGGGSKRASGRVGVLHAGAASALFPCFSRQAIVDADHGDAFVDGADQRTEVAADAFGLVDARNAGERRGEGPMSGGIDGALLTRDGGDGDRGAAAPLDGARTFMQFDRAIDGAGGAVHVDALVRAVPAGDVAEVAA